MEKEIERLKTENELLLKERTSLLASKGKNRWIKIFLVVGMAMFIVAIFETMVSMALMETETVKMDTYKIWFAIIGFVFVAANDSLGSFANLLGKKAIEKFS